MSENSKDTKNKDIYIREKYEEWIRKRVEEGVFPSVEEAKNILAYYAWCLYTWSKLWGMRVFIKKEVLPLTLDKIFELGGDIYDNEKMDKCIAEIKKIWLKGPTEEEEGDRDGHTEDDRKGKREIHKDNGDAV